MLSKLFLETSELREDRNSAISHIVDQVLSIELLLKRMGKADIAGVAAVPGMSRSRVAGVVFFPRMVPSTDLPSRCSCDSAALGSRHLFGTC